MTGFDRLANSELKAIYSEKNATLTINGNIAPGEKLTVEIMDISGRRLMKLTSVTPPETGQIIIPCGHLSPGIFFWVLTSNTTTYSGKFSAHL
jgi:hypothetical protein